MSINPKDQPSIDVKKALPQRLHHNARVVKDHERTRHFYEDIVGMPLIASGRRSDSFQIFRKDLSAIATRSIVWQMEVHSLSLGLPSRTSTRLTRQSFNPDLITSRLPYLQSHKPKSNKIWKKPDIRRPSSIMVTVSRCMYRIPTI